MGRELYQKETLFRREMDRCFEIMKGLGDEDIKEIIYPNEATRSPENQKSLKKKSNPPDINQTEIAPLTVFIVEYALAKLLIHWRIMPHALIGYSFGEYAAACISGVFSLEDALKLLVYRGQLIQKMPPGAMLSVPLSREELVPLLQNGLSLAIDNGPSSVVSGSDAVIQAFEKQMKEKKVICMRIPMFHALHSNMMAPIGEEFEKVFAGVNLNKPQIPYISNVTGGWIKDEEATDPGYWVRHLTGTVYFADGMEELLKESGSIFLEIGPGRDLSTLAIRHIDGNGNNDHQVMHLVRHPHQKVSDVYFLLDKIGKLWFYSQPVDWSVFHAEEKRRRIPLPTYPFERQRYWIDGKDFFPGVEMLSQKLRFYRKPDIADWFYIPSWKRSRPFSDKPWEVSGPSNWLIFMDQCGLGKHLKEQLEKKGQEDQDVIAVVVGTEFEKVNDQLYTINPQEDNHYVLLLRELCADGRIPARIVHLWNITSVINEALEFNPIEKALDWGFYSLLNLAKALGEQNITNDIQIVVVSNKMQEVTGKDGIIPQKASILGPVRVIPAEYTNLSCRSIDIILPDPGTLEEKKLVNQLLKEFIAETTDQIIAFRDNHRWVQTFEPVRLERSNRETSRLKEGGVYFITGGLGGIGLAVAQYLAKNVKAKLVLTGRTPLPPRDEWERWLKMEANGESEGVSQKIQKVLDLEKLGSQVLVFGADVENPEQMQAVITQTKEHFGRINGVIHLAGVADGAMIQIRTRKTSERVFSSKIRGTLVLDRLLKGTPLDFFILCSSTGSILSQIGQVGYCAANCFLDAFANGKFSHDGTFTSINWDRWQNLGIASIIEKQHKELTGEELTGGITPGEGVEALGRILAEPLPQVIVSTRDLGTLIEQSKSSDASFFIGALAGISGSKTKTVYQRPDMDTEYVAPSNETEQIITHIWENFFGFEQIGIRDDFFEMGGDSLKAVVVLSKIHKKIDVEVPIHEIFNRPTIEKLSQYINSADKSTYFSIEPAEEKEYYALSFAQKRLFILQKVAPNSVAYNESLVEIFEGHLAKVRLERIFRRLIERHESLRTSFELWEGEPVQRIHDIDNVAFKIEYYNAKRTAQTVVEESPASIRPNFIRPFDLSQAPLLRAAMIKRNDGKDILMVDMHHIISDGISLDLLIKDFKVLYDDNQLTELRIRYKDYTEWQNSKRVQERIMQQEEYWLKRFKGEIPVPNLPADYPRPAEQSFEGRTRKFKIGREQTQQLRVLASQEEATIFMKVLTIFYIFLFKIGGQEDIVVGTPTAGRRHSDLEDIIGMLVNTLPLRNYPKSQKTFKIFLKEVKEKTLGDFEHQEYPFEELIDKLNVDRDISRNPIFDIMFILHGMETRDSIDKLYSYEKKVSRFDLTLQGFESGENLFFRFEYCTKLFKEETIERFVGYFKNIVSSLIDHPHQKLWEIEIMPDMEKNQVLYAFNETSAEYPENKTIHALFEEQVERTPHHAAVVGTGTQGIQLSYKKLNEKSNQLANQLREKGVRPGIIVGILMERDIGMMIGLLAILKSGGTYLPLDPEYPEARMKYILRASGAGILLTQSNFIGKCDRFAFAGEVIDIFDENLYLQNKNNPVENVDKVPSTEPAYVIYTSGSTGNPKGVVVRHRSAVNFITGMTSRIDFSPGKTILALTTISFDIFFLETLLPITCGMKVVIADEDQQKDPQLLEKVIIGLHVNMVQFTPSRLQLLLNLDADLACLQVVDQLLVGGEAFPVYLFEQVKEKFQGNIYNVYGPTETAIWSTVKDLSSSSSEKLTIGMPIANTQVYIVDKYSRLQPVGIAGELLIGGDGVAAGYLNNVELTAEKFILPHTSVSSVAKRVYKTGDLARWLVNGEIESLGRMDHQVKIRGFRIELEEIEDRLLKHRHIKEAVVVSLEDESGDKYLAAYIVPGPAMKEKEFEVSELREYLLKELPDYMIPSYFVQLEKMPLTPNGKIDRKTLPGPGGNRPKINVTYAPPKTDKEKIIARLWQDVLKVDKVGVNDNFFDLGGNSMNLIQLNSKLNEAFGEDIAVVDMFRYSTINSFLQFLDRGEKDAAMLDEQIEESVVDLEETMGLLMRENRE